MKPVTTIQDVARHAGVSVSTVSNVLNGRGERMRADTLARVETAIEALSYRPSLLARQLKTGQTPLLGLLVPSMTNPIYGSIAREIETFAQELAGFRLLLGSTYRDKNKEAEFFDDLLAHGVRRVIVISSLADEQHFESAVDRGMVVVSYDRRATPGVRSNVAHITPDNFEAARMATAHLIAHGHTRLAFVTAAGLTMSRRDKIAGFYAAAEAAGLSSRAQVIDGGALDEYGDSVIAEVGRNTALRLATDPERPTGLVALNDLMAIGLMGGLREGGLSVPRDVSVVGIDGLYMSALVNPMLTTVHLPIRVMARAMVERVMDPHPDSEAAESELVFPPTGLLERESVGPPPGGQTPSRAAKAGTPRRAR